MYEAHRVDSEIASTQKKHQSELDDLTKMELNELKENPQVQKLLKFMFKESGKKTDDKQKKSEVRPKDPIARKLNLTDKRKKSNFAKGNNESKNW